jgi:EmrB/QacA subfamily drug resistance transporter
MSLVDAATIPIPTVRDEPRDFRASVVVVAACTAYLLVMMDYSVINVALQSIQQQFGASNVQLQWVVNAYETLFATLMLPAGFLADRFGPRRVVTGGLILFAIGSAGIVTSDSATTVILWRAVMGIGGSVVPATTLAVISDVVGSPSRRARVMGIWAAMAGASLAVGPVFSGALVAVSAWWIPFLVDVPVMLACAVVFWWACPNRAQPSTARLDRLGVLFVTATVACLVFAVSEWGVSENWGDPAVLGPLVTGVVLMVILVRFETRQERPVLDVRLLGDRAFASGTVSVSLLFFALAGLIFLSTFYLQLIRRQTTLEMGFSMVPLAVGSVIASFAGGAARAHLGQRGTVVLGMGALTAGLTGFACLGDHTTVFVPWLGFLAIGVGLGLVTGVSTPLTMSTVPPGRAGAVAGTVNLVRGFSVTLGIAVLGAVYSAVYSSAIGGTLSRVDPGLPSAARQSYSQTLTALSHSAIHDPRLLDAVTARATEAFLGGFHTAMWIAVLSSAGGMIVGLWWIPRGTRRLR